MAKSRPPLSVYPAISNPPLSGAEFPLVDVAHLHVFSQLAISQFFLACSRERESTAISSSLRILFLFFPLTEFFFSRSIIPSLLTIRILQLRILAYTGACCFLVHGLCFPPPELCGRMIRSPGAFKHAEIACH